MVTFLHVWELLIAVLVISVPSGKIKILKYKAESFRERIMININKSRKRIHFLNIKLLKKIISYH